MFGIKTIVSPQNALKMTYFCSSWPTLCWILLKLQSFYLALGLECHRFLWISFSVLAISIVISIIATRHRRAQRLKMERTKDQLKMNRQDYKKSMDNLMLIRTKEKHLEQYDNLFLDLRNAPGTFQLKEKKSHSFSTMPRKTFRDSTEMLRNCNSTSTQTVNLLMKTRAAVLKAINERNKREARLKANENVGKFGFNTISKSGATIGSRWGNCTIAPKSGIITTPKTGNSVVPKSGNVIGSKSRNTIGPKSGNTMTPRSPFTIGPKAGTALGLKTGHTTIKPSTSFGPRSASNIGDKFGRSKNTTPRWRN